MLVIAPRSWPRTLTLIAAAAVTLLAATGVVEVKIFAAPTTLKYGLTVAAPLLVFLGASIERPLRLVVPLVVVAAPFANATASAGLTRISLLVPLLIVGFALRAVQTPSAGGRAPALRWAGLLVIPLLAIPIAVGSGAHGFEVSLVTLLAVAWLTAAVASEADGIRLICGAIAVQVLFQAAIAIWEAKTGHSLNLYSSAGTNTYGSGYAYNFNGISRPTGTFNDPIGLANALALGLPVAAALPFAVRGRSARIAAGAAIVVGSIGIAYALDRTAWIGVLLGLIAFLLVLPRDVRKTAAPWVATGALVLVVLAIALGGSAVTAKFSTIFHPTETTGQTQQEKGIAEGETDRLVYWDIAWRDGFLRHPIAGVGIDDISTLIASHSNSVEAGAKTRSGSFLNAASTYLQFIGEAGILGLAVFFILFAGLIADLRAALRAEPVLAAGFVGGVLALLVCWVTDVVVVSTPVAACVGVLFGTVAGAGRFSSAQKRDD